MASVRQLCLPVSHGAPCYKFCAAVIYGSDYSPDMARSCCPQYTIRLDAKSFKPGKKHRQVINRFNRFLSTGSKPGEGGSTESNGHANFKGKGKGKANDSWVTGLREFGLVFAEEGKHPFRVSQALFSSSAETVIRLN
jgi:arginine-tRNA-protein transferase